MVEATEEVGNARETFLDLLFGGMADANDHLVVIIATVSVSWVDAARAVVLIVADKTHVVSLFLEPGIVGEEIGFEGAIDSEVVQIDNSVLKVEAQSLTMAHGIDDLLSDVLAHIGVCLSTDGDLDDFALQRR